MKIAIVTNGSLPVPSVLGGGVETLLTKFIEENEISLKHTLEVFSIENEEAKENAHKYKYTKIIYMGKKERGLIDKVKYRLFHRYPLDSPYSYKSVAKYIEKNNFDKVIIENTTWPFEYYSKKFGNKLFLHIHNDWINNECTRKDIENFRNAIERINKVIVVSNYMKKRVTGTDVRDDKVKVLYNCTDISKYGINDELEIKVRKKYEINTDEKVLLYVGRISPEKGVKELIQACKKISDSKLVLMIVGRMEENNLYVEELKRLASTCSNRIIFTGYIDNEKLYELYSMIRVQIIPSIWEEPFGLVAIEALYRGVPVICTESGGLTEVVKKEYGMLVKKDENIVEHLHMAITKIMDDSYWLKLKEGAVIFSKTETQYSRENYYLNFIKILENNENID